MANQVTQLQKLQLSLQERILQDENVLFFMSQGDQWNSALGKFVLNCLEKWGPSEISLVEDNVSFQEDYKRLNCNQITGRITDLALRSLYPHEVLDNITFMDLKRALEQGQLNYDQNLTTSIPRIIKVLPPELGQELMNIHQNALLGLEERAHDIRMWLNLHLDVIQQIKELDLSDLGLTVVPPELKLFTGIVCLDLSKNNLTAMFPGCLIKASELEKLYLTDNHLIDLHPKFLMNAKKLRCINLGNNQLTELPPQLLINANNLEVILINDNPLTNLPPSILNNPNRTRPLIMQVSQMTAEALSKIPLNPLIRMHIWK